MLANINREKDTGRFNGEQYDSPFPSTFVESNFDEFVRFLLSVIHILGVYSTAILYQYDIYTQLPGYCVRKTKNGTRTRDLIFGVTRFQGYHWATDHSMQYSSTST